jgi:hypothetical protein
MASPPQFFSRILVGSLGRLFVKYSTEHSRFAVRKTMAKINARITLKLKCSYMPVLGTDIKNFGIKLCTSHRFLVVLTCIRPGGTVTKYFIERFFRKFEFKGVGCSQIFLLIIFAPLHSYLMHDGVVWAIEHFPEAL